MPVGSAIAAVMPTMSSRSSAIATSSSANTDVHFSVGAASSLPVSRSNALRAVQAVGLVVFGRDGSRSPCVVTACTITGPPNRFARRSADSIASMSCPSTGPTYLRPRSSNMPCGATASLMPFFTACSASNSGAPTSGVRPSASLTTSSTRS